MKTVETAKQKDWLKSSRVTAKLSMRKRVKGCVAELLLVKTDKQSYPTDDADEAQYTWCARTVLFLWLYRRRVRFVSVIPSQ